MAIFNVNSNQELITALSSVVAGDAIVCSPSTVITEERWLSTPGPITLDLGQSVWTGQAMLRCRAPDWTVIGGRFLDGTRKPVSDETISIEWPCTNLTLIGQVFINNNSCCIRLKKTSDPTMQPHDIVMQEITLRDIPAPATGDKEGIQLGQGFGNDIPCPVRIYRCDFLNVDTGTEIISVKNSSVTVEECRARDCAGSFGQRSGHDNVWRGNQVSNCLNFLRVNGRNHLIEKNSGYLCRQAGLTLYTAATRNGLPFRQGAYDCTFKNNTMIDCASPVSFRHDGGVYADFPRGNTFIDTYSWPTPWSYSKYGLPTIPLADILAANTIIGGNHM